MGLEMFLEARRPISPIDLRDGPKRRAIGAAIGFTPPNDKPGGSPSLMEVTGVMVAIGHWYAFWPLHNWFINQIQEGHDDGRPTFVSPEVLEALEEILDEVDDDPDVAGNYFQDVEVEEVKIDPMELDFTLRVIIQARKLQSQGWDIYYRGDW